MWLTPPAVITRLTSSKSKAYYEEIGFNRIQPRITQMGCPCSSAAWFFPTILQYLLHFGRQLLSTYACPSLSLMSMSIERHRLQTVGCGRQCLPLDAIICLLRRCRGTVIYCDDFRHECLIHRDEQQWVNVYGIKYISWSHNNGSSSGSW